jgi:hypothetical protein
MVPSMPTLSLGIIVTRSRLSRGAWVDTPVLRRLVVAAIAEAAGLP